MEYKQNELQSQFWSIRFKFWIYFGLEKKLAILGINFSNQCLILFWEHCVMVLCVSPSPSFRMHPSEMRPCSHWQYSDEGGSSHPQEVKCRHTACGRLNKQLRSSSSSCRVIVSFTVLCLSGIADSLTNTPSLTHRLAERGLALAGSGGGVSTQTN